MGTALFAAPLPAEEPPGGEPTPAARRAELLDRWERWRRAPLTFREVTVRSAGERSSEEEALVAQRFPDRVVWTGGSASGRVGGRGVGCDVGPPPRCHDAGPSDADAELAVELDELRAATSGPDPAYRLSTLGEGCFRLRLVRDEVRPAFGSRLDVCFDDESGVLRREVGVVGGVTSTVRRVDVATVTAADLELPAPAVG